MRKGTFSYRFARWVSVGALAACVSGCATAQPSGRRGLLESPSVAGSSAGARYRRTASAANRSPASRVARGAAATGQYLANPSPLRHGAVEITAASMHWPLQHVRITSPFGKRGREFHEGIDLKAQEGTPVLAAQDGTVIYAGSKIRGYGKLIVIRHLRQISTIYAHNSRLFVRAGQYVHQGQKISITGQTGHVTGPHLHFEVRDGLAALNPMDFLPGLRVADDTIPTAPAIAAAAVPTSASAKRLVASRAVRPAAPALRPRKVVAASRAARAVSYSDNDN
jgi:murein DD-endopeptidase MepM/ murein hydrolase activator NlpD